MNDEQIVEYLRSRSRVDAPMGLSDRVMAEITSTPVRRSWFAGFLPAVATVAVVAVVAVVALLVVKQPPAAGPSASPSFPIMASDPRYAACSGTTFQDQVIAAFPLVAANYQRHFPNMGRSPELEVDQPAFAVVFNERIQPPGVLGGVNQSPPAASPSGHMVCVYVGEAPRGEPYYYVDVDLTGMRAELETAASPSPTPTQTPTPVPTPQQTPEPTPTGSPPPGYVTVQDLPITVLANAEADALFAETQRCISEAGYAVDFPASWHANSPTDTVPACSRFGPGADVVWITVEIFDGNAGYTGETPIYMSEQINLGGFDGHRAEFGPDLGATVATPSPERTYWYLIPFGNAGPTFIAQTRTELAGDYPLARAVLDRIVASITFDR